jgi:hypothetical protein
VHFLKRAQGKEKKGEVVSNEASALCWFIDANIPFAQFDNDLFRSFCVGLNQNHGIGSARTVKSTTLPALYRLTTQDIQKEMKGWPGYFTTFDGWGRQRRTFVSQHYHGISTAKFEYSHFLLDFIEMRTQKFNETLAAALKERQDHWTAKMPEIVVAGATADGDEKMQSAGRKLYDLDMVKCNCHQIQLIWLEARSKGTISRDLAAMENLVKYVIDNVNINKALQIYQATNELECLNLVISNETRQWSGDYRFINRILELRESLGQLRKMDAARETAQRNNVKDFLQFDFFERLKCYKEVMEPLHDASLLFQTQRFPTGCFVPLVVHDLKTNYILIDDADEEAHVKELKENLSQGIKDRLCHIIEHDMDCDFRKCVCEPHVFLKSSFFHPGVWNYFHENEVIDEELQQRTRDCVIEEALNLLSVKEDFLNQPGEV